MEAAQNTQGKTLGLFSTTRMTSEVQKGSKIQRTQFMYVHVLNSFQILQTW